MRGRRLPVASRQTSQGAQNLARTASGLAQGRSSSQIIWLPLLWKVLIEKYRPHINMPYDIFLCMVWSSPCIQRSTVLFEKVPKEFSNETRFTNEILSTLMRRSVQSLEVVLVFSNIRHEEFGAAIDGEVLITLPERGA